MSFKFLKGNSSGFTLVELMVVVAIIGILSSVAIPSFKRYQSKAKTSEAKLHLASIYSAEVSFFSDADSYMTCLADMGYDPSNTATQRYYTTGFSAPTTGIVNGGAINGITCSEAAGTDTAQQEVFPRGKSVGGQDPPAIGEAGGEIEGSIVDGSGANFVAAAGGVISAEFAANGGSEATSSVFKSSIDAYAQAASTSEAEASNVRGALEGGCASNPHLSVWGVNDSKEIIEVCKGY